MPLRRGVGAVLGDGAGREKRELSGDPAEAAEVGLGRGVEQYGEAADAGAASGKGEPEGYCSFHSCSASAAIGKCAASGRARLAHSRATQDKLLAVTASHLVSAATALGAPMWPPEPRRSARDWEDLKGFSGVRATRDVIILDKAGKQRTAAMHAVEPSNGQDCAA